MNKDGIKEVLGMYLSESEGANYWLQVLTHLHNRGLKDILIACTDNLSGFSEAIRSVYPKTDIQLCIIHQIRNSMRYVASKDSKAFMKDLNLSTRQIQRDRQRQPCWTWKRNAGTNTLLCSDPGTTTGNC